VSKQNLMLRLRKKHPSFRASGLGMPGPGQFYFIQGVNPSSNGGENCADGSGDIENVVFPIHVQCLLALMISTTWSLYIFGLLLTYGVLASKKGQWYEGRFTGNT